MKLLKEYINLLVDNFLNKKILNEDIDIQKLSPNMIGIYAFAQAINKLIYEGNALPGAVPIDIIDAGLDLKSAPMTTNTEQKAGMSFQYSGNSFKLYLNPTKRNPRMDSSDETHDIIHAFTANIAKAFGRRRPSIEKSGQYMISPSRFNKITIDHKVKDRINDAFEKEFGFRLPEEAFTKPFVTSSGIYGEWFKHMFMELQSKTDAKVISIDTIRRIGADIYMAVNGDDFRPGIIGRKYYARYPEIEKAFRFDFYHDNRQALTTNAFNVDTGSIKYNQSVEDEEELGNKMNDYIADSVSKGKKIESLEKTVDRILDEYTQSAGLTGMPSFQFNHRYNTTAVRTAMITLFQIYNNLLERYKKAQSK